MKILFVNFVFLERRKPDPSRMGLSIPYLISYLKDKIEVEIEVFDFHERSALNRSNLRKVLDEFHGTIDRFSPDYVGFTAYLWKLHLLDKMTKRIKQDYPSTKILVGGLLGTMLPEKTLELLDAVDVAVIGSGEDSMLRLIKGKQISDVGNIVFRQEGKIKRGEGKVPEAGEKGINLMPAREYFNMRFYTAPQQYMFFKKSYLTILGSRGCYAKCDFCLHPSIAPVHKKKKIEEVVRELHYLVKKYNVYNFYFMDPQFDCSKKRIRKMRDLIVGDDVLSGKMKFIMQTRGMLSDPETLQLLKEAGCEKICLGIESGSQRILDEMQKKTTVRGYLRSCRLIQETGIKLELLMITGYYAEKAEDIQKTIDFIKRVKPDNIVAQELQPTPNTVVYKKMLERGIVKDYSKAETIDEIMEMSRYNDSREYGDLEDPLYREKKTELRKLITSIQFMYILKNLPPAEKLKFMLERENIDKLKTHLRTNPRYLVNLVKRYVKV